MSELLKEIEERRARRALSDEPIAEDVVERIMRAATYAPSCFNNQPWRLVAVNETEPLERVKTALTKGNYWAQTAPLIVLVATKHDLDCQLNDDRNYAMFDLGLAAENLILQRFKEGLIAHPVAGFNPEAAKKAMAIPPEYTLITLIIIGRPGDGSNLNEKHREMEHDGRSRKDESEVVSYNRWFD